MIRSFTDTATEDIFNGVDSMLARKKCPAKLQKVAMRKLDQLDSVVQLPELRIPPGNRFESLHGNREGQYSIRINEQYRICFSWTEMGPIDVEIVDYH
jgi:toxin HigB-1